MSDTLKSEAIRRLSDETATLRARVEALEKALNAIAINANRILDVYPADARGTYFDDLKRSVKEARAALEAET